MRFLGWFLILFSLCSCGPAVVLYTDDLFRASAPEIVRAWESLPPWKNARIQNLPAGSGLSQLKSALKTTPPKAPVLVGVWISPTDRHELVAAFPKASFVYFAPDAAGEASFVVDPLEAWSVVARTVGSQGKPGTVLFPQNSTRDERSHFAEVWSKAGGGILTTWVWPEVGNLATETGSIFQWVGPEADSRIVSLKPSVPIHGHPGTTRPQGAGGLTWKIQEQGLGDFLWNAAWSPEKRIHFLPLETVPANR